VTVTDRIACSLVSLTFLAAAGCSVDAWLSPFGSYYYYVNGYTGQTPSLFSLDTTSTTSTTTGGTTDGTNGDTTSGLTDGFDSQTTDTSGAVPDVNDDFSDGTLDGWDIISGTWVITTDGAAQSSGPTGSGFNAMVIGLDSWTDYEVELDIRLDSGEEYAVGVRWQNSQTWYHCSHTVGGIASVFKYLSGAATRELGSGVSTPLDDGTWYHWRIVVQGRTITFYVEGEQVLSVEDGNSPITSGKVALLVRAGSILSFDNVTVRPIGG